MTTYNAIKTLIKNKVLATYEDAWNVIMKAYYKDKIDGYEFEKLVGYATSLKEM